MKSETLESMHFQSLSLIKIIVTRSMEFRTICIEVLSFAEELLPAEEGTYIVTVDFSYCPGVFPALKVQTLNLKEAECTGVTDH